MAISIFNDAGLLAWVMLPVFIYLWIAGVFVIVFHEKTKYIKWYFAGCGLILILGIVTTLLRWHWYSGSSTFEATRYSPIIFTTILLIPLLLLGGIAVVVNRRHHSKSDHLSQ